MEKFDLGDQVVVIGPQDALGKNGIGLYGTIVKCHPRRVEGYQVYGVDFEEELSWYFHTLDGLLSNSTGYYFQSKNITLASIDDVNIDQLL